MCITTIICIMLSDLTPPQVQFLSTPSAITNQGSGTFHFSCINEWRCTYMCGLHVTNETLPQLVSCSSPWMVSNLLNGGNYMFTVIATDGVGNVGSTFKYSWKIGKKSIHVLHDTY